MNAISGCRNLHELDNMCGYPTGKLFTFANTFHIMIYNSWQAQNIWQSNVIRCIVTKCCLHCSPNFLTVADLGVLLINLGPLALSFSRYDQPGEPLLDQGSYSFRATIHFVCFCFKSWCHDALCTSLQTNWALRPLNAFTSRASAA